MLGGLFVLRSHGRLVETEIRRIRSEYNEYRPLRWSSVDETNYLFYRALVYLFLTDPFVRFRVIRVSRRNMPIPPYRSKGGLCERFRRKMYYYLIDDLVLNRANPPVRLVLDPEYTSCLRKRKGLLSYLLNALQDSRNEQIQAVEPLHSDASNFAQLCGLLLGMVGYAINRRWSNSHKDSLLQDAEGTAHQSFRQSSRVGESKIGIYHFFLKKLWNFECGSGRVHLDLTVPTECVQTGYMDSYHPAPV